MENSSNLFNVFNLQDNSYIKNWIWQDRPDSFGFSLIKNFPDKKSSYKPALTKTGQKDSVVLIKIAALPQEAVEGGYPVFLSVSTVSRYLVERPDLVPTEYNFSDEDSPTEESLLISSKSRQPISLTDQTKYRFNYEQNSFYDLEEGRTATGTEVVDYIYNKHIATLNNTTGLLLRTKSYMKGKVSIGLFHTAKGLSLTILPITGRTIKNKYDNMPIASFHYAADPRDLEDITQSGSKLLNLESLLKVTPLAAFLSSFTVIALFVISFYLNKNPFQIIPFFEKYKDSEVFSVALIVLIVIFWNRILPFILLKLLNSLIKLQWWVDTLKFKI